MPLPARESTSRRVWSSSHGDGIQVVIGDASRRGLLRTVLGSATATALATFGRARGDAAAAGGACKPACDTCQRCKKVDCGPCPCDAISCAVCQTCGAQGACEPSPDGTIRGTRNGDVDFLRCCDGICPDPDCVPSGSVPSVPCADTPDCAGLQCCSEKVAICSAPCFCLFSVAGEVCASDHDCNDPLVHPEVRSCIRGECVIP